MEYIVACICGWTGLPEELIRQDFSALLCCPRCKHDHLMSNIKLTAYGANVWEEYRRKLKKEKEAT